MSGDAGPRAAPSLVITTGTPVLGGGAAQLASASPATPAAAKRQALVAAVDAPACAHAAPAPLAVPAEPRTRASSVSSAASAVSASSIAEPLQSLAHGRGDLLARSDRAGLLLSPYRLATNGLWYLLVVLFVGVNLLLLLRGALLEVAVGYADFRAWAAPLARACGVALNFNLVLVVVMMSQGFWRLMHNTWLMYVVPATRLHSAHQVLAWTVLAQTVVHGGIQAIAYGVFRDVPGTFGDGVLGRTQVLVTGTVCSALLLLVCVTAVERVRTGAYRVFWTVHRVGFPAMLALMLFHGVERGQLMFVWFALPAMLIYLVDLLVLRVPRSMSSLLRAPATATRCELASVASASPPIVVLELPRPADMRFRSGQVAMLQLPAVSREPHPFTIASSPSNTVLRFYIEARSAGGFTDRLVALVRKHEERAQGARAAVSAAGASVSAPAVGAPLALAVRVLGVVPAPAQFSAGFAHVALVCGLTGITPFLSMMRWRFEHAGAERLQQLRAARMQRAWRAGEHEHDRGASASAPATPVSVLVSGGKVPSWPHSDEFAPGALAAAAAAAAASVGAHDTAQSVCGTGPAARVSPLVASVGVRRPRVVQAAQLMLLYAAALSAFFETACAAVAGMLAAMLPGMPSALVLGAWTVLDVLRVCARALQLVVATLVLALATGERRNRPLVGLSAALMVLSGAATVVGLAVCVATPASAGGAQWALATASTILAAGASVLGLALFFARMRFFMKRSGSVDEATNYTKWPLRTVHIAVCCRGYADHPWLLHELRYLLWMARANGVCMTASVFDSRVASNTAPFEWRPPQRKEPPADIARTGAGADEGDGDSDADADDVSADLDASSIASELEHDDDAAGDTADARDPRGVAGRVWVRGGRLRPTAFLEEVSGDLVGAELRQHGKLGDRVLPVGLFMCGRGFVSAVEQAADAWNATAPVKPTRFLVTKEVF